jgi:predicted TIM-barrel fold metal-dependent hydrolase
MQKLFSVDDHIVEHSRVWSDRVPAKYREAAPHVILEDGREFWEYEDKRILTMGLNAVAGKPRDQWDTEPAKFTDMIPGCYDPVSRAKDLINVGILASVSFPTLPRFGGALFPTFKDKELADVCVRAWNDYVLDEWCPSGPPGLYVPMTICQLWDPERAAQEVRRCVEKGTRSLCFVENPTPLGLPGFHTDAWDVLWDVVQEADIPISCHIASSGTVAVPDPTNPNSAMIQLISLGVVNSMMAVGNVLLSPMLHKFPGLKFVWSEAGIGWVPSILERIDRQVLQHNGWVKGNVDILPSELFARNMWCCMIEEPQALQYRQLIGVDKVLWENDYPHADTPWPLVQESVDHVFTGIPQHEIDMMTHGNAEKLFNWEMADAGLIGGFESDKPVTFDAQNIVYAQSTLAQRCRVMTQTGSITEICGTAIGDDGRCEAGHSAGDVMVAAGTGEAGKIKV